MPELNTSNGLDQR